MDLRDPLVIRRFTRETPVRRASRPGVDGGTVRELHVVATSEDGRHVVLATRKGTASGEYRVAIDDRLAAAVRGDLPRPGEDVPAVVTPKEIQARLRAGESIEQVAASAGVPVAKIDRYAGPVLAERERVITQARAGFVSRSRLGPSALPLGEAVDRHLADTTGVRPETVTWSARREDSGTWLVELSYVSQARRRSALWRYDVPRREVTAVDSASAQLAHVEPGRGAKTAPVSGAVPARPAARPGARRTPVRRTPAATSATRTVTARPAPPAVRSVAARPAAPAAKRAAGAERAAEAGAAAAAKQAAADKRAEAAKTAQAAKRAQAEKKAQADKKAAEAKQAKQKAAEAKQAKQAEQKAAEAKQAKQAEQKAAQKAAQKARAQADKKAAKKAELKAEKSAEKTAQQTAEAQAAAQRAAELEAERAAATPAGPPTLRVVGADGPVVPARRGPKEPPAAARTAPARVAGQRASVPGWADVLLSTAPVARPTDPDPDQG